MNTYKNINSTVHQVAIVGGGIIGICCALALQKAGQQVLLIERDDIGSGASGGNAGHIAGEQIYPIASLSILKEVPKMLLDPLGPLSIDYRYLPQLFPWFIKLLLHLRREPYAESVKALQQLNCSALSSWEKLLDEEELSHLLKVNGSYLVAEKAASVKALQAKIALLTSDGVAVRWVEKQQLHKALPALNQQQLGGLFFPQTAHVISPALACQALEKRFREYGGKTLVATVKAVTESEQQVSLYLDNCEAPLTSQQVIVAGGVFSVNIVKSLSGIKPPLQAERGYHLMVDMPEAGLSAPVTSIDRRFIMTPMSHGLRLAGTVEYTVTKSRPNYKRAESLLRLANGMLAEPLQRTVDMPWSGLRPTLPDSLPVIDRIGRVTYAFGHQHLGYTQAPVTAQWVTALITEQMVNADLTPYRLSRFK